MADVRRLPRPVVENWEWQERAACRRMDGMSFFHPENERGANRLNRDERAKLVCRRCPVITECRRHALAVPETYGVWGGLTEAERRSTLIRRGRRMPA